MRISSLLVRMGGKYDFQLGSLLHHSQDAPTPTTTGIPMKRSSQKIAFKMKVTKFAIVQRPRIEGTNPVDWRSLRTTRIRRPHPRAPERLPRRRFQPLSNASS